MKNADLIPGTKIIVNCQPEIGKSAVVIAPSRQGDECIIVEIDSDHQTLVVNVNDVEVLSNSFEDKLIADLLSGIQRFGTYNLYNKGAQYIMDIPMPDDIALIGEDRLVALLENLCGPDVPHGEALTTAIYNAMEPEERHWPLMDGVIARLSDRAKGNFC